MSMAGEFNYLDAWRQSQRVKGWQRVSFQIADHAPSISSGARYAVAARTSSGDRCDSRPDADLSGAVYRFPQLPRHRLRRIQLEALVPLQMTPEEGGLLELRIALGARRLERGAELVVGPCLGMVLVGGVRQRIVQMQQGALLQVG